MTTPRDPWVLKRIALFVPFSVHCPPFGFLSILLIMIIADLAKISGRTYPARRRTQNLVGGASPIQAANFAMGHVTLEPDGGQVPWHNQEQEEIYFIVEGTGEMCLGEERIEVRTGQAVYIPPTVFHP